MENAVTSIQAESAHSNVQARRLSVVVIDMQPITPAIGGGRLRLLGLYHALGPDIQTTYLGSYDWPGEPLRDHFLTASLREICIPLSEAHHAAAAELSATLNGATVIDAAFSTQVLLSPHWIQAAAEQIRAADVVVFSHPWAYPPLHSQLLPDQLVIYDSQNVESVLKADLLGLKAPAAALVEQVTLDEHALCSRADLILACSRGDIDLYAKLFSVPYSKMRLVPNGTFTARGAATQGGSRAETRAGLNIEQAAPVAAFMGSAYAPNKQAVRFIADVLCRELPEFIFLLIGGAGDVLAGEKLPANLRNIGVVDEFYRDRLLQASDIAINPMNAGSGTNIKMFDYLAAGLPVVTTEIGARGICDAISAPPPVKVVALDQFAVTLRTLFAQADADLTAMQAREFVRQNYSWEHISPQLGQLLSGTHAALCKAPLARRQPKIWILGTWNITCGIAQHASYLAEALKQAGAEVLIVGNHMQGHAATGFHEEMFLPIARAWTWDNRFWQYSGIDIETIESLLARDQPDCVLIQHHTGFMPAPRYEELIYRLHRADVHVGIEFHDARKLSRENFERLAIAADTLMVHAAEEYARIPQVFQHKAHKRPLPVRAVVGRTPERTSREPGPIVGGFGFLRPYKGVLTAIRTVAELRSEYPDIRYRGWHALYDGDESQGHLAECLEEIRLLGIEDHIDIDTAFQPLEHVISGLRRCDVVFLPYAPSIDEGASAAVNCALAATRATVVSAAKIFSPVSSVVRVVGVDSVAEYSAALRQVLSNADLRMDLEQAAQNWAAQNSYSSAARALLSLMLGA